MSTTTTTKPTLTDRYVYAATRRLGKEQRDDVALELRAGIDDRIEALLAQNPSFDRAAAEHAALVELGDPDALAASYTGAPQRLIGPELYPAWSRATRAILVTVVPLVTAIIMAIDAFSGESIGRIAGHGAWTAMTLVVHICFWVTVSFVIVERSSEGGIQQEDLGISPWTPESLPELPRGPQGQLGESLFNVAWLVLLGALLVWQQVAPMVRIDGERLPVIDPDLWSFWMPLVLATLACEIAFEAAKYRAGGGWTPGFAALNTVTGLVFAAPIAWLASQDRLLNPALVQALNEEGVSFDAPVVHTAILVAALGIWLWDTVDGWRKVGRA